MNLAVVIPCYNVSKHIEAVVRTLPAHIRFIIVVDDYSKDNTLEKLRLLSAENQKVVLLQHAENRGVGAAMLSGYRKAIELQADIVIKMDGDGQMDPQQIDRLIQPLIDDQADFTKANRFRDFKALRAMPLSRRIGNLGLSFIIKAASGYWNIFDPTNGFTAIKSSTLLAMDLNRIHARYYFETSMLLELYYANAVIVDVPMQARYGDEISGLSRTRTLLEFPPRLLWAFIRRMVLKYFLFDFNIASLYLLSGVPLFLFGLIFGLQKYSYYASNNLPAPTGTVVIPTLLIILGFQLLLSAITYDVTNYPKK